MVLTESEHRFRQTQNMAILNLKIGIRIGVSRIEGTAQYRREKKQIGRQQVSLVHWETKLQLNPEDPPSERNRLEILDVYILNEELQKYWHEQHRRYLRLPRSQQTALRPSPAEDRPGNSSSGSSSVQMSQDPTRPQTVTVQKISKLTDLNEVKRRIEKEPDRFRLPNDRPCKELFENMLRRIRDSFYFTQKNGDSFQDGVAGFLKPELAYSIMQKRQIHVPEEVFCRVAEKRNKKVTDPKTGKEIVQEEIVWKDCSLLLDDDFRTFLSYLPQEMPTQAEVFFNDSFMPLRIVFRRTDHDPKDPQSGFLIDLDFQSSQIYLKASYGPHDFVPTHNDFEDSTEEFMEALRK